MATLSIRQKLISYLADAEESKINAVYMLLKNDIVDNEALILDDEQIEFLKKERELHLQGISKSYSRDESLQIIRGERGC